MTWVEFKYYSRAALTYVAMVVLFLIVIFVGVLSLGIAGTLAMETLRWIFPL
jgi:hypothetical protein